MQSPVKWIPLQRAAHELLSFHSIASLGSRAQQNSAKEPRNDRAIVVDSEAKSKRLNKPNKENEKGIEFKSDIEHYLSLYLVL